MACARARACARACSQASERERVLTYAHACARACSLAHAFLGAREVAESECAVEKQPGDDDHSRHA
eukprot:4437147-Pleurochrysis_carterae.AAC.1